MTTQAYATKEQEQEQERDKNATCDTRGRRQTGITELVLIVDRSGSMSGLESDTIGGINATLEKNREVDGTCNVSIVLFDDVSEVIADRVDLGRIKKLTSADYQVRGCTALLDAVGGAIKHTRMIQRNMPDAYKAEHVIFTIITDGIENASRRYTYPQVKEMITGAEAHGWEFLFLGANIDAAAEAAHLGIRQNNAANYVNDGVGVGFAYAAMADAQISARMGGSVSTGWAASVNQDFEQRGGGGARGSGAPDDDGTQGGDQQGGRSSLFGLHRW